MAPIRKFWIPIKIFPGECVAIMGPSASGKATRMHLLGRLDHPTSGSSRLAGQEVAGLSRDRLAVVRNKHVGRDGLLTEDRPRVDVIPTRVRAADSHSATPTSPVGVPA